jgi:hypothetical protein
MKSNRTRQWIIKNYGMYIQMTVIWEPNESTLEKKFQRVLTLYKVDKCVITKINQKTGSMGQVKF